MLMCILFSNSTCIIICILITSCMLSYMQPEAKAKINFSLWLDKASALNCILNSLLLMPPLT